MTYIVVDTFKFPGGRSRKRREFDWFHEALAAFEAPLTLSNQYRELIRLGDDWAILDRKGMDL